MLTVIAEPATEGIYSEIVIEHGEDGGKWAAFKASELGACIRHSHFLRLQAGEILCQVKERMPRQFDRWLQEHWPEMSRSKVTRLMAVYRRREELTPFMDEDGDFVCNTQSGVSATALERIAMGGADPAVVSAVQEMVAAGQRVSESDVLNLNRKAKAQRKGSGAPRQPQPVERLAINLIKRGQSDEYRQALALAEQAQILTAAQVLEEVQLRELPKGSLILGIAADFHRQKDGSWIRLPHAGRVEAEPAPPADNGRTQLEIPTEIPIPPPAPAAEVLSLEDAAARLGIKPLSLQNMLVPSRSPDGLIRGGFRLTRAGRGMVRMEQSHGG